MLLINDKNRNVMDTILRQIRNEWRSNLFLFAELLLVFIVLWYVVDLCMVTGRIYTAPMGYDVEHCYQLTLGKLTDKSPLFNPSLTVSDDVDAMLEIVDRLRHRPGVEAVAVSQNCAPYNDGGNVTAFYLNDSIQVSARLYWVQPDFFRVFRYHTSDGRGAEVLAEAITDGTIVITSNVAAGVKALQLPDASSLLNREVAWNYPDQGHHARVAAVATPVRCSHFEMPHEYGGSFIAYQLTHADMVGLGMVRAVQVSLRVRPDADRDFVAGILADVDRLYQVGNVYLLDVQPYGEIRHIRELEDTNEAKTELCAIGFLLLNIFLGVIGTFWFRTQHRRLEVAVRMAMGSTRRGIFFRLIGEGLLLLTVAALPAALIAFNAGVAELVDVSKLPFDGWRFLSALLLTWLLMAVMIVTGIWFPASQAMRIQPAEALHDE